MSSRSDALYLHDIKESVQAIESYIKGLSSEDFKQNRMVYSAVIREFEIIGEAVGKLSDDIKTQYADIHWRDIKDFRNMLIHEYFGVDLDIVWSVVKDDLPALYRIVNNI